MRLSRESRGVSVKFTDANGRGNAFRGRALLATTAAVLVAGCGDVYNTYNYNTADTADAGSTDAGPTCKKGPDLVCGDKPIQSYVRVGQTLDVGELHFQVLEVGDEGAKGPYVIVSIQDPDCNETAQVKFYRDQPQIFSSVLGTLKVSLLGIYTPENGNSGAVLHIESPCYGTYCTTSAEILSGTINQGEHLLLAAHKVQLDDITNESSGVYAILSILDENNNTIANMKIKEGQSAVIQIGDSIYLVHVKTVAPGYTFGAKWADISISPCI